MSSPNPARNHFSLPLLKSLFTTYLILISLIVQNNQEHVIIFNTPHAHSWQSDVVNVNLQN